MKESIRMFKNWLEFAKPNKKYLFIATITISIFNACVAFATIFSAKIIVALTVQNFKGAIVWLLIALLFYIFRNLIEYIHFMMYPKLEASSFIPMQTRIVKKMFVSNKKSLQGKNMQKINNIMQTEIYNVSSFGSTIAYKCGEIVEMAIVLVTIFYINAYVGLVTIAMMLINSYIINFLQEKYAKGTQKVQEAKDKQFLAFSKILEHKDYAQEDKVRKKLEKDYISACSKYMATRRRRQPWYAFMETWYWVWCETIITLVTIFMVILIEKNSLSLEMYLVVVPYINSAINSFNEFMVLFKELKQTTVYLNRVKVISNFTERDMIKFGNNNYDDVLGEVDFIDVYTNKFDDNPKLYDVNFHVRQGDCVLIKGGRNSGKRTLLNLVMRYIEPKRGDIFIDGLNIKEYSKKAYRNIINYTSSKPHFYDGTILKELKMANSSTQRIEEVCKQVGIYKKIMSLKNGFHSMPERLGVKDRFLLGLARCILTNPKIILIYEFPSDLNKVELQEIYDILESLKQNKTILIFSANEKMADVCDKIVEFENGTVKNITFNKKEENLNV